VNEKSVASIVCGDKVEAAYRRGDLFEKRCKFMEVWALFCTHPIAMDNVLALRSA
jgi:hypothetical protein